MSELTPDDWGNLIALYHFTTPEAARAIIDTRTWVSAENTGEVYGSDRVDGQATGYGTAYVHVILPRACVTLDDEFPDGEKHYRFLPADAFIVTAVPNDGLTQHDW